MAYRSKEFDSLFANDKKDTEERRKTPRYAVVFRDGKLVRLIPKEDRRKEVVPQKPDASDK